MLANAVRIIADRAREAVRDWDMDLHAHMDTTDVAARLDIVARDAMQQFEDYLRQVRHGFFDEAAEERAVDEMYDTLNYMLDPY